MRFAIVTACAVFACAAPVAASQYLQYEVSTEFTGQRSADSNGGVQNYIATLSFSYVVDLAQVQQQADGSYFFPPRQGIMPDFAMAGSDRLRFYEREEGGGTTQYDAVLTFAPGAIAGIFPETLNPPTPVSSTFSFSQIGPRTFDIGNGRVTAISVTGSDATPAFLGFRLNNFVSSPLGVPEPASWAMMIAGFGLVGGALRGGRTGHVARKANATL
jgi:hypothetical protein